MGPELSIIASIAGTAMSALGAIKQGNAAKSAADYNARVASNNAIASRQQAEADAQRQERESRLRAGANRAAVGGMGVQLSGSPIDVLEDNAMQEELDRLRIIHAGDVRATGFENTAQLETFSGSTAHSQSRTSAAGTLIFGGAKAASRFGGSSKSSGFNAIAKFGPNAFQPAS